ncbi:SAM-dependent methyltransferase [Amycolatopsis rubida]|uniref:SAM-dependent methyltransferase n=1 Tax=Amycolatopsis rubida TaxID=112413 RepID=A0ABX0C8H6_9PSEU|nr:MULTISPECIES: SAM-dependent methyltransferase [Amycolatopsis]MYW96237.1 SAM-dependent methyltransferase [Amycolatopsis rubida]NEC61228.1 SAM-dependent methyltransferase [Amycolatopsis rubida]OAP24246.1 hypothetical protein A4R44_05019 [Amycolatopsis sp. M39]
MHRNETSAKTSPIAYSRSTQTRSEASPAERVLVCCAYTDAAEQKRLAEGEPQNSLTFVKSADDLKLLRDNGHAQFDAVILNQVFEPDWAEPVLMAWSLLADNGTLLAVVPQDWGRTESQHARAAQEVVSQFGRVRRSSRRARRAGIPADCSILACSKRGRRTDAWWQRVLRRAR